MSAYTPFPLCTNVFVIACTKAMALTFYHALTPPIPFGRRVEVFSNSLSMDMFHRRLGHSGEGALRRLLRGNMATGIG